MNENEKPNYFAILTADVRYDERLSSTEKLLFAEITALASKEGMCWASNKYFAKLYNVTPIYISKMINKLKQLGYIQIEIIYKPGTHAVQRRNIYLLNNSLRGIKQKFNRGIKQKFNDNNINNNNIKIIKDFSGNTLKDDYTELYEN